MTVVDRTGPFEISVVYVKAATARNYSRWLSSLHPVKSPGLPRLLRCQPRSVTPIDASKKLSQNCIGHIDLPNWRSQDYQSVLADRIRKTVESHTRCGSPQSDPGLTDIGQKRIVCARTIRPGAVTLIANVTATAASEDRCETRGGSRPLNETGVRESPSQEVVGSPFDLSDAPNIDRCWNADSQARVTKKRFLLPSSLDTTNFYVRSSPSPRLPCQFAVNSCSSSSPTSRSPTSSMDSSYGLAG